MQRALERRGVPTVSVTVARDITAALRPPRAVFVPFMMGHHFGVPGNVALQRAIVLAALRFVYEARASGEIRALPYTWAAVRRELREGAGPTYPAGAVAPDRETSTPS